MDRREHGDRGWIGGGMATGDGYLSTLVSI